VFCLYHITVVAPEKCAKVHQSIGVPIVALLPLKV